MPGGGESRPGQLEMCEAVASALDQDRHLVVAAGTGTGKSMAYLAPLAASGKKAVVATATKALQDQLVDKDLPLLAQALGRPLEFGVLKGRSNYICRKKLADLAAAAGSEQRQLIAADSAAEAGRAREELRLLAAWAEVTDDGDRAGLDFEPSVRAWEAVSVSGRECPGAANCPSGPECFAEHARDRAAEADVLVVNHHLYCLDVFTEAEILPAHDAVVLDEAHTLEDISAAAAGVSITGGRFRYAARAVRAVVAGSAAADGVAAAGDILRDALDPHRDKLLTSLPDDLIETAALCRDGSTRPVPRSARRKATRHGGEWPDGSSTPSPRISPERLTRTTRTLSGWRAPGGIRPGGPPPSMSARCWRSGCGRALLRSLPARPSPSTWPAGSGCPTTATTASMWAVPSTTAATACFIARSICPAPGILDGRRLCSRRSPGWLSQPEGALWRCSPAMGP